MGRLPVFTFPCTALSLNYGGRGDCHSILFCPRVPPSQKKQRNQTIEFFRCRVRRIFGSKIEDIFHTFFQNKRLSNRSVINTDLKNAGTKVFSRFNANVWARLDKITYKAFKLNSRLSIIFFTLYLYFPDVFQVWKIAGLALSRIQDSVRTPRGALLFGCVVSLVVRNLCLGNYTGDPRL